MSGAERPSIVCPDCGTSYRWRSDFAGQELHFQCGAVFRAAGDDPDEAKDSAKRYGHCAASMGGSSPVVQTLDCREDEAKPSRVVDLYLPIALLVIGWILHAVLWFRIVDGV